ncbi:MAG: GNAT family N-acetyltransferase [Chloroflexota bacterium]
MTFLVESRRLLLVETPREILSRRLSEEDFEDYVNVGGTREMILFPSEWPGDSLGLFPHWIDEMDSDRELWSGTIIDKTDLAAVGQMGFKGLADKDGVVEIGYNVSPAYQRRGYATEMAGALSEWALRQRAVRRVAAECLAENIASIRVLEKAGFVRTGSRSSDEGPLIVWNRLPR